MRAEGWGLVRTTADGHRITFTLASPPDAMRPRLFGWGTLAVPTGIVSAEFTAMRMPGALARAMRHCPACGSEGHDIEARFCRDCGAALPVSPAPPASPQRP